MDEARGYTPWRPDADIGTGTGSANRMQIFRTSRTCPGTLATMPVLFESANPFSE